ncbi:MAG: aspartate/glutamate racemase family protein [Paracoccaceae bacterium]|nr:aspartate/glutamate racemase family protein [Paracoccaceae bacterium]
MTEHGGKTIYGATLGILMLETRFPRVHGDIGNALTWPFPVQYRIVPDATPEKVVLGDPEPLVESFIAAGRDLVASGCDGVATNCGFLVPLQDRMAEALGVPVASSSLMQVPAVARTLPPGREVGILTISAETLTARHLQAAGIPEGTPMVGTDRAGEFASKILSDAPEIDFERARRDVVDAAARLVASHPAVGAIVLECTNMVPYARDVRRATGLPVFSIYSYLAWFQAALLPRKFDLDLDDPRQPRT